jgi:glycogen operon protein
VTADWFDSGLRSLGVWIDGSNCRSRTRPGELVEDHSWLLLLHAGHEQLSWTLPAANFGAHYELVLDTARPDGAPTDPTPLPAKSTLTVPGRSILLLRVIF